MQPDQNNQQTPQTTIQKDKKDEQYAEALAKMAALDYQMEQKDRPVQKHFISKKVLIYIIASLIISVIAGVIFNAVIKDSGSSPEDTTKELLNTTKQIQDLEN